MIHTKNISFVKIDGTEKTGSFNLIPVNIPKINSPKLAIGCVLEYSTSPTSSILVDNVYKIEKNTLQVADNWYVNSSASLDLATEIVSGSLFSGSIVNVEFDLQEHNLADEVTNLSIKPFYKYLAFSSSLSSSFVVSEKLNLTTDSTGFVATNLLPNLTYEVVVTGHKKSTKFYIRPSNTPVSQSSVDILVTNLQISPFITSVNQSEFGYTAQAADARFQRSGSVVPQVSCSYANSSSFAISASHARVSDYTLGVGLSNIFVDSITFLDGPNIKLNPETSTDYVAVDQGQLRILNSFGESVFKADMDGNLFLSGSITASNYPPTLVDSASVATTASMANKLIGDVTGSISGSKAIFNVVTASAYNVGTGQITSLANEIYGGSVPTIKQGTIKFQVCDLDGLAGMSLIHTDSEYVDMNFIVNNGGFLESRVRYETRGAFTFTGTPELQYGSTQIQIGGFGFMPNMFLGGTYSSVTTGLSVGQGMTPTVPPTDGLYVKGKTGLNVASPTAQLDVQGVTTTTYVNYTDYPNSETFTTTYPSLQTGTVTGTYYDTGAGSNQSFYDLADGFLYSNYDTHIVGTVDYGTGNVDTSLQTNSLIEYPLVTTFTTFYPDIEPGSTTGLYQDAGTLSQQSFYDGADGFLYSNYDNHIVASINYSTGTVDSTGYVSETIDQINYSYLRNEPIVDINYNYQTSVTEPSANFNGDVSVTGSISTNGAIYSTHGYPTFMGNPGDGRFQLITTTPGAGDVGFSTFNNGFNFSLTGIDGGASFYCDYDSNTAFNRRGGTQTFRLLADGTNVIYDGSGTGIRLNGSGNVSIGTTTATNKLTVQGNISCSVITASAHVVSCVTKTTNYTLTPTDSIIIMSGSTVTTASLPSATTLVGKTYKIKNTSTYPVYVSGSQRIDGTPFKILSQYDCLEIGSCGNNWNIL
jgi:hypothetical protein